jgi:hypothetical protein
VELSVRLNTFSLALNVDSDEKLRKSAEEDAFLYSQSNQESKPRQGFSEYPKVPKERKRSHFLRE